MINILSDNEDGEPNFFGYIFSYLVASWECLSLITNLYSSTFHPTVYPVALFKNPTLTCFFIPSISSGFLSLWLPVDVSSYQCFLLSSQRY